MEHATTTHTAARVLSTQSANAAAASAYVDNADRAFADSRQRLIAYLVKLNQALDQDLTDLSQAILHRFCESLVDYLSAGHFSVFQRVALAADEYAAIESTTRLSMAFNDAFADQSNIDIAEVKTALENLAQILGTRFELEDDIILADRARRH